MRILLIYSCKLNHNNISGYATKKTVDDKFNKLFKRIYHNFQSHNLITIVPIPVSVGKTFELGSAKATTWISCARPVAPTIQDAE